MNIHSTLARLSVLTLALMTTVVTVRAMSGTGLTLEPHCVQEDRTSCPGFVVQSADHLTTPKMNVGDILDLDVILTNAEDADIEMVRSWLKYDPNILEARSVEALPALASPTPNELTHDASQGIIKIGGSTAKKLRGSRIAVARVTLRVKSATENTEISFHNFVADGRGETAVLGSRKTSESSGSLPEPPCFGDQVVCQKGGTTSLMLTRPSTLTVMLADAAVSSSAASMQPNGYMPVTDRIVSSVMAMQTQTPEPYVSAFSSSLSMQGGSTAFSLLQVQNLRAATQDTNIFLGWNALHSSDIAGYNVYYGTVSGRYIQRRSIPKTAASLVLRDLEKGTTYYLAIRAFNAAENETVYSQEVSVEVGNPSSSSSPLSDTIDATETPRGNPLGTRGGTTINGSTGMGDDILLIIVACAIIGTGFAAHRQYAFGRHSHVS